MRPVDKNTARDFLNTSAASEYLNSGFMQIPCHLLKQGSGTCLNRKQTSPPLVRGTSLRQKEIRTHARQALAFTEREKTSP